VYLSKYLSGDDFERYHFSQGWVFSGWIGWSKWYKKNWGVYPDKELVRAIAKLPVYERNEVLGLYRSEVRLKSNNRKRTRGRLNCSIE